MKRNLTLAGMALAFAGFTAAQDTPRLETFLGYDMLRYNSATNIPALYRERRRRTILLQLQFLDRDGRGYLRCS